MTRTLKARLAVHPSCTLKHTMTITPHFLARFALLSALSCLASCTSSPSAEQPPSTSIPAASIDRIVDDVIARYQLPGIALGVIVDGQIVYKRTSGELIVGSAQKINDDSLFKIASNSKAMTTALLARLVDAGKLH